MYKANFVTFAVNKGIKISRALASCDDEELDKMEMYIYVKLGTLFHYFTRNPTIHSDTPDNKIWRFRVIKSQWN